MRTLNCQPHKPMVRLISVSLLAGLLTSCQTAPETSNNEVSSLNQLNVPPEQLPMWSESPLDSIGNVVGYLPRQTAKLMGAGNKKDRKKPEKPQRKTNDSQPPPSPISNPSPSPSPSISKASRPKAKASPKPKPKTKATPRAKPAPSPTPVLQQAADSSVTNATRNDILRGKTIQENPLGPRQPIEL